jgi:hypothetical protein
MVMCAVTKLRVKYSMSLVDFSQYGLCHSCGLRFGSYDICIWPNLNRHRYSYMGC